MKKRLLFYELKKQFNHKNALVITGMRQVGKTTLMRQIFDETQEAKLWFDFDNPLDHMYFENVDYKGIYEDLKQLSGISEKRLVVFIDEIQNFPEITRIIKYLIDHYRVKFVVTGSSNYYLKNLFPESLSGRKFLYELQPMSFSEFLYFHEKKILKDIINYKLDDVLVARTLIEYKLYENSFNEYLEYGGFPEVVMTQNEETKKLVLKNILTSFFEKDIRLLSDIREIRELRDLMLLLVPRVGNILDITKISGELGVNRVKIYNFLELLQGTFFIKLLPKYSKSVDRSVAGGRKVYFTDNGLLNVLGRVNEGQLFENSVSNQLAQYGQLSFFNKRNTAEIDFILDNKISFEVKLSGSVHDLEKLGKLSERIGIKEFYLVSRNFIYLDKVVYPEFI